MGLRDSAHPISQAAEATTSETPSRSPGLGASGLGASGLPSYYTPRVAGYAAGPFLEPAAVTPTDWRWRNTRTYIVRHSDGQDYRALRVFSSPNNHPSTFVGYWAVERLGEPLTPFDLESRNES